MPFTSVAEFLAEGNPSTAELALIAACRAGVPCYLPDGTQKSVTLPLEGEATDDRHIRARLLRLLALGGTVDCKLNTVGVWVEGAYITGNLDLRFTKTRGRCVLDSCRFDSEIWLAHAEIAQFSLERSHLPGLAAQSVKVDGNFFLTGLTTKGTINLAGATIGGRLDCDGATLNGDGKLSLNARGLKVVRSFHFRDVKEVVGTVDLASAHVGDLMDNSGSLERIDKISLDGFTYNRIGGTSALTRAARAEWLAIGSRFGDKFRPQPYTQFARVLRVMGHGSESRKVLAERDRLLFAESHKVNRAALKAASELGQGDVGVAWIRYNLNWLWDWFTFLVTGYGHSPQRALFWSLACIGFGAVWFFIAWAAGVMVPNSAIIMTSPDWLAAMVANPGAPSHGWTSLPSGTHYETFYALPYALDMFLPFVSLGQEQAWAATTASSFGILTRWFTFAYQITGWAVTALGVATVAGFVQKNQPD